MASSSSSSSAPQALPQHLRPTGHLQRVGSHSSHTSRNSSRARNGPPPQPAMPHHEANAIGGSLEFDSADPVIQDFIYRYDTSRDHVQHQQLQEEAQHRHGSPDAAAASVAAPSLSSQQHGQQNKAAAAVAEDHLAWLQGVPWYRRPTSSALLAACVLLAVASGTIMSSRVELFTQLVCEELAAEQDIGPLRLPHERPPMTAACRTDPDVISASAQLQMKVTLAMGILSALTTGWWGGLSDRKGRTKIISICMIGFLSADLSYLALGLMPITSLPFGTNFLLFSSVLEGLLGGIATIMAAHQAYISDCTPAGTRAKVFARLTGFFYCGIMLGPGLGGWLIRVTDSIMSTFILAASAHFLYWLLVTFALPESTSPERRKQAERDHKVDSGLAASAQDEEESGSLRANASAKSAVWYSRLTASVQPLRMLFPREVEQTERLQSRPASQMPSLNPGTSSATPPSTDPAASASHISVSHISRKRRRDWNLFWLSCAYGLEMTMFGFIPVKSLYAQEVFNWGPTQLGFYMTFVSVARVITLTAILPLFIKYFHRPPAALSLPQDSNNDHTESGLDDEGRFKGSNSRRQSSYGTLSPTLPPQSPRSPSPTRLQGRAAQEQQALLQPSRSPSPAPSDAGSFSNYNSPAHDSTVEELWTLRAKHLRLLHDSHFDLQIARLSMIIDSLAFALLIFFHGRGESIFVLGTALTALGGGGSASMSSLALALLHRPTEAGKLFGAWSILQAVFANIVGPIIFTAVFRHWIRTPHLVFWAGEACYLGSFLCLSCIRIRKVRSLPGLPPRPVSVNNVAAQQARVVE